MANTWRGRGYVKVLHSMSKSLDVLHCLLDQRVVIRIQVTGLELGHSTPLHVHGIIASAKMQLVYRRSRRQEQRGVGLHPLRHVETQQYTHRQWVSKHSIVLMPTLQAIAGTALSVLRGSST